MNSNLMVVKSYDRDDQLALRVEVMERWARHCLNVALLPAPRRTTAKVRRGKDTGATLEAGRWA